MNERSWQWLLLSALWIAVASCGGRVAPDADRSRPSASSMGGSTAASSNTADAAGAPVTLPIAAPVSSTTPGRVPSCDAGTDVFYTASNYVLDIAQDHEWLYVLTQEELLKVSKGSNVSTGSNDRVRTSLVLAREKTSGWFQGRQRIAVHDGTLYWAKGNDGAIWRIPAGGTPEPFIDGLQATDAASGLVVVGSLLYFLRDGHANVVDLSKNEGYRELAETSRFVADPDGCYVVQFEDTTTHELTLSGVNMSEGRSFSTRLPPYSDQKALFANEGFVYYLVDSDSYSVLQRRATMGQRDELVASSVLLSDEMNLAVDGDDVYWTLDDGSLYHVSIGQGTAGALMSRQFPYDFDDYDGFLLLDNDYVYWQAPIDSTPHDDNDPLPILRTCRVGRSL